MDAPALHMAATYAHCLGIARVVMQMAALPLLHVLVISYNDRCILDDSNKVHEQSLMRNFHA